MIHVGTLLDALRDDPLTATLLCITAGMLVGRLNVRGLSLGSSAVLFAALAMGAAGIKILPGVGALGLVLFVYCVGITAGPSFFRVFRRQGKQLALLAAVLAFGAVATTLLAALAFSIPSDLSAGLFAGAMTSTPALAAALELVGDAGSNVSVGYGIAYPFGIVGVVLMVQLLPRLLGADLAELGREAEQSTPKASRIVRVLVEIANPAVFGRKLDELQLFQRLRCQASRVFQGERLVPPARDLTLAAGQQLLLVGSQEDVPIAIDHLGKRIDRDVPMDTERERIQIIATSPHVLDKKLSEITAFSRFGVTISRMVRNEVEFVPRGRSVVHAGDVLTVVGAPADLRQFADFAGHRSKAADETDIISLVGGILIGACLGMIHWPLPGDETFALGLAGGPMIAGLLLGHFGKIGPIAGHIPRASRIVMMELGLVLFLADAGASAGASFLPVFQQYGLKLALAAASATVVSIVLGLSTAHYLLRMSLIQALGGICGGMTSTPGLGVITAKTDSNLPVVSYAAAYPVALILTTICAQLIVSVLR